MSDLQAFLICMELGILTALYIHREYYKGAV